MGGRYREHQFRQRIPRPPTVVLGQDPSWLALPAEERRSLPIARVLERVATLPEASTAAPSEHESRHASFAILVPLFAVEGEAAVLLIRRSERLRRDAGHIAFPGGRVEPGEEPVAGALREAAEEIGLDPAIVRDLRRLESVERVDLDKVDVFLAVLDGPPELTLNADEVDAAVELPLAAFLADGVGWQERWSWVTGASPESERRIHFFADPSMLGDDLIWGLTARVLWSLLELVVSVPAEPSG